jgi:GT2 family glycosyltransferase
MLVQNDCKKYRSTNNGKPPSLTAPVEPVVSGWVDSASWLSDDVLLILGRIGMDEMAFLEGVLILDERSVPLEIRCLSYPGLDLPGDQPHAGKVFTACFPHSVNGRRGSLGRLVIRTEATTFAFDPPELSQVVTDLQRLIRAELSGLDSKTRAQVMEFLASTLNGYQSTTNPFRLSRNLFMVREALRERLPYCVTAPNQPRGLQVDTIMAVDTKSFYINGWMRDEEAQITRLTAVSPEGSRAELSKGLFRYRRPEVDRLYGTASNSELTANPGFVSHFELKAPSYLSTGWTIEMRNAKGAATEVKAPSVIEDPLRVRNRILGDLTHERLPGRNLPQQENLTLNHIFPAVSRLQERLREMGEVARLVQYGSPAESPEISIIVRLDRRIEFLEQQLAQFTHDPEIHQADLIYVLDYPGWTNRLLDYAAQLFRLYQIPLRIVTLKRDVGFAVANNVGVSLARGRRLVLLNAHVLPDKPGWLGRMAAFYDSTAGIGALGPKLLYEDSALRHAGMCFYWSAESRQWKSRCYFKGFHRRLPAANVPRPVPVGPSACLMVDSELYRRLRGMRNVHVEENSETADFCLRVIEEGYQNWYLPDAELYHLEEEPPSEGLQQQGARYDAWVQMRLWNEQIEALMARYAPPESDQVTDKVSHEPKIVDRPWWRFRK